MLWILALVENTKATPAVRASQFPHLVPRTEYWGQAFLIEMMCAFIFVTANILVKDKYSDELCGMPTKVHKGDHRGWYATLTIAMTLAGLITFAGPHTGAAINPAVAVANHVLSNKLFRAASVHDAVFKVYILGGVVGGVLAGIFSWAHKYFVTNAD